MPSNPPPSSRSPQNSLRMATVAEARGSKAELAGIILDAISAWRTH